MSKEKNKNKFESSSNHNKGCGQKVLETTEGDYKILVCEKNDNAKPQNVIIPPNLMADPDIDNDDKRGHHEK